MVSRRSLSFASSVSPSATVPEVGRSSPAATFRNVLLPDPDGPMIAVNDPGESPMVIPSSAPHSSAWFVVLAIASLVLAIFARRRFAFAAPAAYWLLAAGISFVDWRLVPFVSSLFVVGMAAAFLLGNVRDARQAGIGLAF